MKGYRKVLIIGGIQLLAFLALMFGKLDGAQFMNISMANTGVFGFGNAVEHRSRT